MAMLDFGDDHHIWGKAKVPPCTYTAERVAQPLPEEPLPLEVDGDGNRYAHLLPTDLQAQLNHIVFNEESCSSDMSSNLSGQNSETSGKNSSSKGKDVSGQETPVFHIKEHTKDESKMIFQDEDHKSGYNKVPAEFRGSPASPLQFAGNNTSTGCSQDVFRRTVQDVNSTLAFTREGQGPEQQLERMPPQMAAPGQQMENPPHMLEQLMELHEAGECRPCLYLNSKAGCHNGAKCRFCHMPHPKRNRSRPCKAKRAQCKHLVNMLYMVFNEDSNEFQEASKRLSSESSYMRSILGGAQRQRQIEDGEDDLSSALAQHQPP